MSQMTYAIYSLCQGWRTCDASLLLYLADIGREARLPYFFWLLVPTEGGSPIVVDTGFTEAAVRARNPLFEDYRQPRELLAPLGLKPSEAETLILTHLHWDHFAAPRLFSSAQFYLQRKELDFWRSPAAEYHFLNLFLADLAELDYIEEQGRLHLIEEEAEIAPGVTCHWVGGHTPGLQVVRVRTLEGWAVLAADAAYVYRSFESMIPPGIHVHVDDALRALDAVKNLADSPGLIFPGHDVETLKIKEEHPGVRRLA